jgi:hypothetical protein
VLRTVANGSTTVTDRLKIDGVGAWTVNGSAGSAGAILTSAGSSGPPTWSTSFTGLVNATGGLASTVAATGTYAGVNGSNPNLVFYNSGAAQYNQYTNMWADSSGTFHIGNFNGTASTTDWLTMTRTTGTFQTAQTLTLATQVSIVQTTPAVYFSGYHANNTTINTALGAVAGVHYGPVTATNYGSKALQSPFTLNSGSSSGVSIGASASDSSAQIQMYDSGAATGGRGMRFINWQNAFKMQFMADDCVSNGTDFLNVGRTGGTQTAATSVMTAAAMTFTASTSVLFTTPTFTASAAFVANTSVSSPLHTSTGTMNITAGGQMQLASGGVANPIGITTPGGATVGAISITTGTATAGAGGNINLTAGGGSTVQGSVVVNALTLSSNNSVTSPIFTGSGAVTLQSGTATTNVTVAAGATSGTATITAGTAITETAPTINLNGATAINLNGPVVMSASSTLSGGTVNSRVNPRSTGVTSGTTITINSDTTDYESITSMPNAFTIANPTGTPVAGQRLTMFIGDNATARAITWGTAFNGFGVALPSTTVASHPMYVFAMWNALTSKWDVYQVVQS